MAILKGDNIVRVFPPDVTILKGVSIAIEAGTFNVLMGPSGSGKTTLMNQLGLLDTPTSGEIFIEGQSILGAKKVELDALRRSFIGYIFQSVALISNMTAYQNVDFALRICGYPYSKRKKRIETCMDMVGLKERMHHYPLELSGGEQQRVAIARAIAHGPKVLLADEPTAELDTETGLKVVQLFKKLVNEAGLTILMCTHDPDMLNVADQRYVMKDGVLFHEG